jgi:hypothetical protein
MGDRDPGRRIGEYSREVKIMRILFVTCILVAAAAVASQAYTGIPAVAVHIEQHGAWDCAGMLPSAGIENLQTTYDGVGKVDAFVVFYGFRQMKGASFGLTWPETWGEGTWHECGDLKLGNITKPGDMTSIVWLACKEDEEFLIAGWVTLTVTSPGMIEVIPSAKEGVIAVLDCDPVSPKLSEAMVSLRAAAGGMNGDDTAILTSPEHRRWRVSPDATGDVATVEEALRAALPGDSVMVAGGRYREHLILRRGVVLLGSWNSDFTVRDLALYPSIIDVSADLEEERAGEAEHHYEGGEEHVHGPVLRSAVEATLGADSTTVLDGFVITGGNAKQGGAITLRNGARPVLNNLILYGNEADYGGGIFCHSSSPLISNCLIVANTAESGGALYCVSGSSPVITNTTMVANHAPAGCAVAVMVGSSPTIEKSIIAGHEEPSAIYIQDRDSGLAVSCSDLWGNRVPQYGGIGEEVVKLRDNVSEDPGFRDVEAMDFSLLPSSALLSLPGCGAIGTAYPKVPREVIRTE